MYCGHLNITSTWPCWTSCARFQEGFPLNFGANFLFIQLQQNHTLMLGEKVWGRFQFILKLFSAAHWISLTMSSWSLLCVQWHYHAGAGLMLLIPVKGNCNAMIYHSLCEQFEEGSLTGAQVSTHFCHLHKIISKRSTYTQWQTKHLAKIIDVLIHSTGLWVKGIIWIKDQYCRSSLKQWHRSASRIASVTFFDNSRFLSYFQC